MSEHTIVGTVRVLDKIYSPELTRLPTGVAGFDRILNGGFFHGGLYIITGLPGAGKTILGNQLCFHTVASGGQAIFITLLTESHSRMLAHLSTLSFFDPAPIGRTLHACRRHHARRHVGE